MSKSLVALNTYEPFWMHSEGAVWESYMSY